jgi:hypothetical protein
MLAAAEGRRVAVDWSRRGGWCAAPSARSSHAAQAADILAVFAQAASTWAILEISEEVARRAEDGFPDEPVRTLDAIHLASALFLRQSFPELAIVSVDERLRSNAALLGFQLGLHQP